MAESFPNAENALHSAFDQPDPTPHLLKLIRVRAHPGLPTITDLVFVYTDLIAESPQATQIYKYVEALARVRKSTITVASGDHRLDNIPKSLAHHG